MRVVQVERFGPPEVLAATEVPDLVAGSGQAVIGVSAADILFLETQVRAGLGGDFFAVTPPYVPGDGVAGAVFSVGQGVDPAWVGRPVVAHTGGYAERVVVPAEALLSVPDGLSLPQAAALLNDGPVALTIFAAAEVTSRDAVLVLAAAGGMGNLLVQLAHQTGARVIGAARGKRKLDQVRRSGADIVVDYSAADWPEQVLAATGGAGADVVLDGAGGAIGRAALTVTAHGGRFSAHGAPSGECAEIDPQAAERCVLVARDFLGDDDFVMYLGDNMLMDGVGEIAKAFAGSRPAAQVVVHKVPDPREFGVAEVDESGSLTRLVEKPRNPRSDLALIGVYFFTPAIHEAVSAIAPSASGELEITDAVQWLRSSGATVQVSEYGGYWKDAGKIEDVLECNRRVLEGAKPSVAGEVDEHSVLIGDVVVEPGARIVRSRIEGPAVVGAQSVVEDSHLGPHTSIGRGCELRGASMDYSIALDGATVIRVAGLHGSIVGRNAAVSTAPSRSTRRHRLVIGDHSHVEVAA